MKQTENQLGIQGHSCDFVPNKVKINLNMPHASMKIGLAVRYIHQYCRTITRVDEVGGCQDHVKEIE